MKSVEFPSDFGLTVFTCCANNSTTWSNEPMQCYQMRQRGKNLNKTLTNMLNVSLVVSPLLSLPFCLCACVQFSIFLQGQTVPPGDESPSSLLSSFSPLLPLF